jgi:hypothetical protein
MIERAEVDLFHREIEPCKTGLTLHAEMFTTYQRGWYV